MSILSLEFLIFAAILLFVYYVLPTGVRWLALLIGSALFVILSGWQSILHLTGVVFLTWGGGLLLDLGREHKTDSACSQQNRNETGRSYLKGLSLKKNSRRILLALLLILEFGALLGVKWDASITAPLGLSYFTFQSAGLLIDIYWGKVKAPKNPLKVWLFAGYFLQLAQGPISSWKEIGTELMTGHRLEPFMITSGFQLMLWGYFKKMVLADRLAAVTAVLMNETENLPGWLAAGGTALYAVRLYADFSGGMDVVRGISRMFGIELPENFRRPFLAVSIADYWRRWHITLGGWFRTYVLYPMTASRMGIQLGRRASKWFGKKVGRIVPSAIATVLVFLLIGIWHGFSWNAVIYGAYFGILMAGSMMLDPFWKKLNRRWKLKERRWIYPVRLVRTWLLLFPAQFFAFTSSTAQSLNLIRQCFSGWSFQGAAAQLTEIMSCCEWSIVGVAFGIVLLVDILNEQGMELCARIARARIWVRWPILLGLIMSILIFGIYGPSGDAGAFLYTQF